MKKALFLVLSVIMLFYACSKNSPTSSTPNVEQTVGAVLAETANANATQTQAAKLYSPTISPTITITYTATASPNMTQTIGVILTAVGADNATATEQAREAATAAAVLFTATLTSTSTETPNVTLTVKAILTVVGAGNATATEQAREIQTAIAILYTPTLTSTITPSPNQTATAAAIGTMIADIHASETEAVILSRTPTPTTTPTITQTWTITDTYTATPTITETATPTITSTSTDTPIPYSDIVTVLGGTFTQTDGTSSFSHTISTFKMGKYLVTYDLWYTVYIWAIANGYIFQNAGAEGLNGTVGAAPTTAKYQPVTTINCRDTIVWCNAFSQKTGLSPVYCSDAIFTTPIKNSTDAYSPPSYVDTTVGGIDVPYVNWSANGYRLPTEGEYQYAARYIDGTNWTPFNYASGATADYTNAAATGLVAWYNANCSAPQNVGGKTANALGIYDMSGNVWEWCWDWYGAYPTTASTDYRGAASGSGNTRMVLGGSYGDIAFNMQVGYRSLVNGCCGFYFVPFTAGPYMGFRFARTY